MKNSAVLANLSI